MAQGSAKPKAALICEADREQSLRDQLGLAERTDYRWVDAEKCAELTAFRAQQISPDTIVFFDLAAIGKKKIPFEPGWQEWNVVLLSEQKDDEEAWRANLSCLELLDLDPRNLALALEIACQGEKFPGLFSLVEAGTEIFFEKVQKLNEIGEKVDRFLSVLEQRRSAVAAHFFNLRQLSYALLHQALEIAQTQSKLASVVDFQVTADPQRIAFAVRFNAPITSFVNWPPQTVDALAWHNSRLSADILFFTELKESKQVEVKAVIGQRGGFAPGRRCSVVVRSFPDFSPDEHALARQAAVKLMALGKLPTNQVAEVVVASGEAAGPAVKAEPMGTELNFKLKADMLANEKNNLQNLVKKKSQLIAGLTKDVNRAQQEVLTAQKNATKEILKIRMEMEKAKNTAKEATKKLSLFQRRMAEKEAEAKAAASASPTRDFEKDWKQTDIQRQAAEAKIKELSLKISRFDELMQKQRKEMGDQSAELNEYRTKNLKLEQQILQRERAEKELVAVVEAPVVVVDQGDKSKDLKKQIADGKNREQELEKEMKRLNLKSEAAEKNAKAKAAAAQKQVDAAAKAMEEAKRLKTEASNKLEELQHELKKKTEEFNSADRMLKKQTLQIADLQAKLSGKKAS